MPILIIFLILSPILILFYLAHEKIDRSHTREAIEGIIYNFILIYTSLLLILPAACFFTGVFWWLKNGQWLTVSPAFLLDILGMDDIREELAFGSGWTGIDKINSWYIEQNIGWTILLALFIIYLISICKK